jgi:hypothetical protein
VADAFFPRSDFPFGFGNAQLIGFFPRGHPVVTEAQDAFCNAGTVGNLAHRVNERKSLIKQGLCEIGINY